MSSFHLTTAINYTNGKPHLGHAYEVITADFFARWNRLLGKNVFFQTGTDEHGQKIAETALNKEISCIDLCNEYSEEFVSLNRRLNISSDFFIRTTMLNHKICAQEVWRKAKADIYLGEYEGWYSTREERFYTFLEAQMCDYKDGDVPLKKIKEESYFFRLSKYQERIIQHIKENPEFIFPKEKQQEILERLKEPLQDLSISRKTCTWGIPVPDDPSHVMYVWFDALTNYFSMDSTFQKWPANIHIIGKDIIWFHAVIWSGMLMSLKLPLPKTIVCHGFINDDQGRKMSKSYGNSVDPILMMNKYGSDPFRYFLLREGSFGSDLSFSEANLKERYQKELANNLGNLVQRTFRLAELYSKSKVPEESASNIFDITELISTIDKFSNEYQINKAVDIIFETCTRINQWLTKEEPWKTKNDKHQRTVVRTLLEALVLLSFLLDPIIPLTSQEILTRLNLDSLSIHIIKEQQWKILREGSVVNSGPVLFPL